MQEHAYRFGRANHLIGVAGLPASMHQGMGVILLNAGLVHRVGPFRLHVEMARRLTTRGYPTLRFDLSTVGDSSASSASLSREQQVCNDVSDAMALLREQAGCNRFVLVGLCSGAVHAHLVAHLDEAVAGAIFLDGAAYRSFGFRLRHYLPRLLSPVRVARHLLRRTRPARRREQAAFRIAFPPQARARSELADMLERGQKLCFIFSGGASGYFNHHRQFGECYGRKLARHPGVSVKFLQEADHTYVLVEDRKRLLDTIERWLDDSFPAVSTRAQVLQPAVAG